MTTQVISTTVSYVTKSSFTGKVFLSVEDTVRPDKKFDKGFFMYSNKLFAALYQFVDGFDELPTNMEVKVLFKMLKGAELILEVTRYEEGEEIDEENIADDVTYIIEIKQLSLSKKGQQELQEQFMLSSLASLGLEKQVVAMLKAKAARIGGAVAPAETPANDATDDADDAPATDDADDIPAYMRKDVKRASLSDDEKELRSEYIKAGNKLI